MCKLSVQITDFYCIYDLIQISNCRAIHFGATVQFFLMTMVSNTKSLSSNAVNMFFWPEYQYDNAFLGINE